MRVICHVAGTTFRSSRAMGGWSVQVSARHALKDTGTAGCGVPSSVHQMVQLRSGALTVWLPIGPVPSLWVECHMKKEQVVLRPQLLRFSNPGEERAAPVDLRIALFV